MSRRGRALSGCICMHVCTSRATHETASPETWALVDLHFHLCGSRSSDRLLNRVYPLTRPSLMGPDRSSPPCKHLMHDRSYSTFTCCSTHSQLTRYCNSTLMPHAEVSSTPLPCLYQPARLSTRVGSCTGTKQWCECDKESLTAAFVPTLKMALCIGAGFALTKAGSLTPASTRGISLITLVSSPPPLPPPCPVTTCADTRFRTSPCHASSSRPWYQHSPRKPLAHSGPSFSWVCSTNYWGVCWRGSCPRFSGFQGISGGVSLL